MRGFGERTGKELWGHGKWETLVKNIRSLTEIKSFKPLSTCNDLICIHEVLFPI